MYHGQAARIYIEKESALRCFLKIKLTILNIDFYVWWSDC